MTDNLRARIAAAIAKADQDWCSDNPLYEDMADAVIGELGLRINFEHRVAHYILTPPSGFLRKFDSRFRWVTGWSDWIADD